MCQKCVKDFHIRSQTLRVNILIAFSTFSSSSQHSPLPFTFLSPQPKSRTFLLHGDCFFVLLLQVILFAIKRTEQTTSLSFHQKEMIGLKGVQYVCIVAHYF